MQAQCSSVQHFTILDDITVYSPCPPGLNYVCYLTINSSRPVSNKNTRPSTWFSPKSPICCHFLVNTKSLNFMLTPSNDTYCALCSREDHMCNNYAVNLTTLLRPSLQPSIFHIQDSSNELTIQACSQPRMGAWVCYLSDMASKAFLSSLRNMLSE